MNEASSSRDMESLPKQFVTAMRTLFDIMDDKHTGYVKLTDIENRWRDDRTKGLPRGVIESLQKVASHDGLLTFDRFCTGLKICLLRNQVQNTTNKIERRNGDMDNAIHSQTNVQVHRPPSAPVLDINEPPTIERDWNVMNTSDNSKQQRTISMPQLIPRKDIQLQEMRNSSTTALTKYETQMRYGPPKPPRLEKAQAERKVSRSNYKIDNEIAFDNEEMADAKLDFEISRAIEEQGRGLGDGRPSDSSDARRTRRREPRRHTLHNGVDYNLLKRMKQIEQEKDILLQGLTAVEEAREWYLKQLSEVQEKMRYAGRMGTYVEPWSEAHQERLELLRARVSELSRQLSALATAGWQRGPLSLHMNLELPAAAGPRGSARHHSQTTVLAEEVNRKNERISILEREKSALIRELLVQRNKAKLMENYS